jgi:hypothetical protein
MEPLVVSKKDNGGFAKQQTVVTQKPIVQSDYVKVDGPFVKMNTFAARSWYESERVSFYDVKVETMDDLLGFLKEKFYPYVRCSVYVYLGGEPVTDLATFCAHVTDAHGFTKFSVADSEKF